MCRTEVEEVDSKRRRLLCLLELRQIRDIHRPMLLVEKVLLRSRRYQVRSLWPSDLLGTQTPIHWKINGNNDLRFYFDFIVIDLFIF